MLLSWKTCLGAYTLHGGGRECVPLTPPPNPSAAVFVVVCVQERTCVIAGTRWFLCPSVTVVGGAAAAEALQNDAGQPNTLLLKLLPASCATEPH